MTPIHVVGVGLSGMDSLTPQVEKIVRSADLLVGSERQLEYFSELAMERWVLDDFAAVFERLKRYFEERRIESVVVLATGDPLFFGVGRLLLTQFSTDWVTFYPNLSSIQLAFHRLKIPWQDAHCVSVHGRGFDLLGALLQKGAQKIAILTDPIHSPAAIATYFRSLDLAMTYQFWVCENLGSGDEAVRCFDAEALLGQTFASLTVLILLRQIQPAIDVLNFRLPLLGLPDHYFQSFEDRPGLMTKREVRILALGELCCEQVEVCWDIGAGTGSMSVELARLMPQATIYAVEKSTAGMRLIENNSRAFQVSNVQGIYGKAPDVLGALPQPDRVFIGGSGRNLSGILAICEQRLRHEGVIVLAIATLEHLQSAIAWFESRPWSTKILHVQLSRSTPIANLTRFKPLNPIYLVTAIRSFSQGPHEIT